MAVNPTWFTAFFARRCIKSQDRAVAAGNQSDINAPFPQQLRNTVDSVAFADAAKIDLHGTCRQRNRMFGLV